MTLIITCTLLLLILFIHTTQLLMKCDIFIGIMYINSYIWKHRSQMKTCKTSFTEAPGRHQWNSCVSSLSAHKEWKQTPVCLLQLWESAGQRSDQVCDQELREETKKKLWNHGRKTPPGGKIKGSLLLESSGRRSQ